MANFHYYRRYVDDSFIILPEHELPKLLDAFNSFHPSIKFTYETEKGGQLAFLDISICRDVTSGLDTPLTTTIYRKPTHTGIYCNWKSWSPTKYKVSVIRALHCRARRICSSDELFHLELKHIRNCLLRNNYPFNVIKSFERYTCNLRSSLHMGPVPPREVENEESSKFFIKLPYCGIMSDKIAQSIYKMFDNFTNSKLQISFECRKVGSFFRVKDKIPIFQSSGCIYHITCGEQSCSDNYIGESKLRLQDRFAKHVNADRYNEFSSIFTHCQTASHTLPSPDHVKVLSVENAWYKRKIMESLFIKNIQPTLNRNVQSYNLKLF